MEAPPETVAGAGFGLLAGSPLGGYAGYRLGRHMFDGDTFEESDEDEKVS